MKISEMGGKDLIVKQMDLLAEIKSMVRMRPQYRRINHEKDLEIVKQQLETVREEIERRKQDRV